MSPFSHLVMRQTYTETAFWHRDSFKINPTYNTDGIGNYLRWARIPLRGLLGWLRRARTEKAYQVASQRKYLSVLGCLHQPGQIFYHPKVYESKFHPLIKLSVPWLILLPRQSQ